MQKRDEENYDSRSRRAAEDGRSRMAGATSVRARARPDRRGRGQVGAPSLLQRFPFIWDHFGDPGSRGEPI